jgi:hypothetical protein
VAYTRLERGDLAGASDSVLEALARALQLDDAERAHLFDLARAAQPMRPPPRGDPDGVTFTGSLGTARAVLDLST